MSLQVENQGKACRKELERALTRAALEQDIGCIDEAEGVIAHKEHRLERLLTQKNIFADDALVWSLIRNSWYMRQKDTFIAVAFSALGAWTR